jgi:hypothetical protein
MVVNGCVLMEIRGQHFSERVQRVCFQVQTVALRTIPRARVPFEDFYVNMGFAERLGKA